MAKRSLQASAEGIRKAKQAFKRKGWTQEYLAAEVGLETRQAIWKFFTGKPIDRHVFNDICFVLELDTSEIVQPFITDESRLLDIAGGDISLNIDSLVQKLRSVYHETIQVQCGTVQILDIPRPLKFNDIYIDIDILEEINSRRWLEINNLPQVWINDNNCLGVANLSQTRISGMEAVSKYTKLMVLGKPGSGKTTFLQAIANSCNLGLFQPDYLPIFIRLRDFAEDIRGLTQISLWQYLHEFFLNFGIHAQELTKVFAHGRALILLDGLDEVVGKDADKIINKIRQFTEKFYKNQLIITCRLGAQNYNFHGFTEVEIAEFSKLQIANFAEKCFRTVTNHLPKAHDLANRFVQKLELIENLPILNLAATPLLLNFICLVFQFTEDFPTNRAEFYKQILDLLLIRWDEARCIKRDEIYPDFSLLHKIKLLSHIAAITFTQNNYVQTEANLRQLITDYLNHLSNTPTDAAALELESASVLKAIESQHGILVQRARGIYSFSHLSLQQYLTAREIVTNINAQTLPELMNHLHERHWREVFLLSVSMLKNADDLLQSMRQTINNLAAKSSKVYDFLIWLEQKSAAVNTFYHAASVRAFYFTLALPSEHSLARNQELAILLDHHLAGNLAEDLALDLALIHGLTVSLGITADIFLARFSALSLALDLKHLLANEPSLQTSLQQLKNQLPSPSQGRDVLKIWWQANGENWTEALRNLMIASRQIGHNWQFNQQDFDDIQQYWNANKLLLDCLQSSADVSPDLRNSLERTLFLAEKIELETGDKN